MTKIHTLIAHYRELRQQFSLFDENGDVRQIKRNNPFHKPLVEQIENQTTKIDWILPVISIQKKLYLTAEEKDPEGAENNALDFDEQLKEEENIQKTTYYNDRTFADESKYYKLYQQLADFMKPFENPLDHPGYLSKKVVKTQLEAIVDNYDDFYSSVLHQNNIVKRRYVIQKYDMGLNKRTLVKRGDREFVETSSMTKPDKAFVKSVVTLPAPVVQLSRVRMPINCTSEYFFESATSVGISARQGEHQDAQTFTTAILLPAKSYLVPYKVSPLSFGAN